jgi:hypothetical protein
LSPMSHGGAFVGLSGHLPVEGHPAAPRLVPDERLALAPEGLCEQSGDVPVRDPGGVP